jgi:hypothetical protein
MGHSPVPYLAQLLMSDCGSPICARNMSPNYQIPFLSIIAMSKL